MNNTNDLCQFNLAWIGKCNKPNCTHHKEVKCCNCGEPATKECDETMGLVCGAPLCDNCEHTTRDNGCNSQGNLPVGYKGHCKKIEQVYNPWYKQEKEGLLTEYGKSLL